MDQRPKRLLLLGSTGSIGRQTVEVVEHLNAMGGDGAPRFEVVGLAAGSGRDALFGQARDLGVREVALADEEAARAAGTPPGVNMRVGADAAERLVREVEADVVMSAVVGFAGLGATFAAVELGRDVALANKETLVAAGQVITGAARRSGASLLPVDSEHSAIWQCLASRSQGEEPTHQRPVCALGADVSRVILTASGGAFRTWDAARIAQASVEDALNHPTWDMGAKVTIDCASLVNKALELIEAHWLFGIPAGRLGAVVHPQSIVHSFVEFVDGSVIAQLGEPDMRTPIQHALTFPRRCAGVSRRINFEELRSLDFEPPDLERFPALAHGLRVIEQGGTAGAVFNGANERAVGAFIEGRVAFGRIPALVGGALGSVGVSDAGSLDDVMRADAEARAYVDREIG